jgi:hypothetical protein
MENRLIQVIQPVVPLSVFISLIISINALCRFCLFDLILIGNQDKDLKRIRRKEKRQWTSNSQCKCNLLLVVFGQQRRILNMGNLNVNWQVSVYF